MRLILARHGETAANRDLLGLGVNDVPLTEKGRLQAEALAEALASEKIAAVYSSPLRRALDTATAIASRHAVDVVVDEGLTEMDVGELDGLTFEEMRARHPDFMSRWLGEEAGTLHMPGGGECLQDVQDRAMSCVSRVAERHDPGSVVVVTHNFTIHALLCHALNMSICDFRRLRHDLAAFSTLDVHDGRTVVVQMNDTCHLQARGLGQAQTWPPRPSRE
jgi:broad specificity phosphatase PhoE